MRLDVRLVQATVLATVCSLATGEPLPPQFTLGRYIPNDAFMFVNKAKNPERAWVERQWTRVYDALLNSGVDRD
ncbi:MAG: hypothetical protein ACE5HE_14135, partial [Phycisphaerae bacterium]